MPDIEIPVWFISFSTALLAAFFGSLLAIRKFKNEKIWQEKFNAYKEILDAIEGLRHWADETYSSCMMLPTIGLNDGIGFYKGYADARMCIKKYTSVGRLLISSQVADELEEMNTLIWKEDFRFNDTATDEHNFQNELGDHAQTIQKIIDDRLDEIIRLSKLDLE